MVLIAAIESKLWFLIVIAVLPSWIGLLHAVLLRSAVEHLTRTQREAGLA